MTLGRLCSLFGPQLIISPSPPWCWVKVNEMMQLLWSPLFLLFVPGPFSPLAVGLGSCNRPGAADGSGFMFSWSYLQSRKCCPSQAQVTLFHGKDSVAQDEDVANTGRVTEAECGSSSFFFLPCVQMMLNLGKAVEAGTGYATQQFFLLLLGMFVSNNIWDVLWWSLKGKQHAAWLLSIHSSVWFHLSSSETMSSERTETTAHTVPYYINSIMHFLEAHHGSSHKGQTTQRNHLLCLLLPSCLEGFISLFCLGSTYKNSQGVSMQMNTGTLCSHLNTINAIYEKSIANIRFNCEKLKSFPLRSGTRQ